MRLGCPVEHHKQGVHSKTMANQMIPMKKQHVDDMNEEIGMADHNDASQD